MDIEELANDLAATDGDPRKLALFSERYIADERSQEAERTDILGAESDPVYDGMRDCWSWHRLHYWPFLTRIIAVLPVESSQVNSAISCDFKGLRPNLFRAFSRHPFSNPPVGLSLNFVYQNSMVARIRFRGKAKR